MSTLLFIVIAFLAAAVASVTGFGSATILMPFASLVLDLKQAIVLVAFFHLFSNAFKLLSLRRSVDRRLLMVYSLPSIVLAVLGAWLFGALEVGALAVGFAGFIIVFAIYSLLKPSWKLPDRNSVLVLGGCPVEVYSRADRPGWGHTRHVPGIHTHRERSLCNYRRRYRRDGGHLTDSRLCGQR